MIISTIVAVAKNNVIGKDNDIPWYLPADLKYFKKITTGHHIVMGRKCYESIGRPLPKRTNVVVTRNPFFMATGCLITHNVAEAVQLAEANGEDEVFIIGGGQIYEIALPHVDRIYLTEVDLEVDGDIFFPEIDPQNWNLIKETKHEADEKNEYNYTFKVLERKKD
jgi:dihydrofolate reductase